MRVPKQDIDQRMEIFREMTQVEVKSICHKCAAKEKQN